MLFLDTKKAIDTNRWLQGDYLLGAIFLTSWNACWTETSAQRQPGIVGLCCDCIKGQWSDQIE